MHRTNLQKLIRKSEPIWGLHDNKPVLGGGLEEIEPLGLWNVRKDKIAVEDPWKYVTYKNLSEDSNRFANYLIKLGIK